MIVDFDKVRIGQLVEVGSGYNYDHYHYIYFDAQPLRVIRKVIRKRKREVWDISRPHPMIEVQSLKNPKRVKLFYADQVKYPPQRKDIRDYNIWAQRGRYYLAWVNMYNPELEWMDIWLPPPPKIVYKPRRTSEEVQQDNAAKKWRKMILSRK